MLKFWWTHFLCKSAPWLASVTPVCCRRCAPPTCNATHSDVKRLWCLVARPRRHHHHQHLCQRLPLKLAAHHHLSDAPNFLQVKQVWLHRRWVHLDEQHAVAAVAQCLVLLLLQEQLELCARQRSGQDAHRTRCMKHFKRWATKSVDMRMPHAAGARRVRCVSGHRPARCRTA